METAEKALVATEKFLDEVEEGPLKRAVDTAEDRVDSCLGDLTRADDTYNPDDPPPIRLMALEDLQGARDNLEEAEELLDKAKEDLEEAVKAAKKDLEIAGEELSAKKEANDKAEAELEEFRKYNGY